ncbi:alcohol dehydrogenase catalytic domain-containing protein [Modicisalibacter coralii]|uniref:alcohol dehydrogenase catalytic domain-containing protein n=1 Tax=Modicisalibacter coralii TaxID=2304602 RepID=UPI00100C2CCF|nr:alcohol dehydrogenase catalytic domain-containing protein [Halomonas coralii]
MHRQTIRAAVAGRSGARWRLETLELDAPRDDEILVRIHACGICHTDLDMAASCPTPSVLGHEGAGIVEVVGRDVDDLAPGDAVVLSFAACGACAACRAGHPADCAHFMTLNFAGTRLDGSNALSDGVRGHFFGQSAFATHALAARRNAVRVDRELDLALVAPLGCGLQTGAGTVVNSLALAAGEGLAIVGAGAVGLGALLAANIVGAEPRVVIEPLAERRELAASLGATRTLAPEAALAGGMRDAFPAGAPALIDTAGDAAIFAAIPGWLAADGRVAWLTGAAGGGLEPGQQGHSVIQGDADPQRFIPWLLDAHRRGDFPLERLITRYPFEAIEAAAEDAEAGRVIKPVLVMDT